MEGICIGLVCGGRENLGVHYFFLFLYLQGTNNRLEADFCLVSI